MPQLFMCMKSYLAGDQELGGICQTQHVLQMSVGSSTKVQENLFGQWNHPGQQKSAEESTSGHQSF